MAYRSPHCSTPEVATSRSNLMESNEVRHSSNRKPWGLTHNLWIWKLALVLLRGSSREPWLFVSNAGFCTFWTYIVFSIREQFSENFSLALNPQLRPSSKPLCITHTCSESRTYSEAIHRPLISTHYHHCIPLEARLISCSFIRYFTRPLLALLVDSRGKNAFRRKSTRHW